MPLEVASAGTPLPLVCVGSVGRGPTHTSRPRKSTGKRLAVTLSGTERTVVAAMAGEVLSGMPFPTTSYMRLGMSCLVVFVWVM